MHNSIGIYFGLVILGWGVENLVEKFRVEEGFAGGLACGKVDVGKIWGCERCFWRSFGLGFCSQCQKRLPNPGLSWLGSA